MTLPKDWNKKIKSILRKLKSKNTYQEYKYLYPTGSQPGKFYDTVKMYKLPVNENLNHLPLRPILSNINTSTYHQQSFCQNYYQHYVNKIIILEVPKTSRWYLSM